MLYDPTRKLVFVHLIRCGGTSIKTSLAEACNGAIVKLGRGRHLRAFEIRRRIGRAAWAGCYKFATIRPPHEAIESDWRLTLRDLEAMDPQEAPFRMSPSWFTRLMRVRTHRDFGRFVTDEVLPAYRPGGYWQTFCHTPDGQDLGVEPIPFGQLADRWPEILARAGLPADVELQHLNAAPPASIEWPEGLREKVAEHFAGDYELLESLAE